MFGVCLQLNKGSISPSSCHNFTHTHTYTASCHLGSKSSWWWWLLSVWEVRLDWSEAWHVVNLVSKLLHYSDFLFQKEVHLHTECVTLVIISMTCRALMLNPVMFRLGLGLASFVTPRVRRSVLHRETSVSHPTENLCCFCSVLLHT